MTKALTKRDGSTGRGIVSAVASAIIPGVGQVINGQTEKGIGMLIVYAVAGASVLKWIPVIGAVGGVVAGVTWLYAVIDGYVTGKNKR